MHDMSSSSYGSYVEAQMLHTIQWTWTNDFCISKFYFLFNPKKLFLSMQSLLIKLRTFHPHFFFKRLFIRRQTQTKSRKKHFHVWCWLSFDLLLAKIYKRTTRYFFYDIWCFETFSSRLLCIKIRKLKQNMLM